MSRTVVVTPAQVDAAKAVVEWSEAAGEPVPDSVRRIAEAGSVEFADAEALTSKNAENLLGDGFEEATHDPLRLGSNGAAATLTDVERQILEDLASQRTPSSPTYTAVRHQVAKLLDKLHAEQALRGGAARG